MSRKRRAVLKAKNISPNSVVWNVCHDARNDLWQTIVIDWKTKHILCRGRVVKGPDNAYSVFVEELTNEVKKRL